MYIVTYYKNDLYNQDLMNTIEIFFFLLYISINSKIKKRKSIYKLEFIQNAKLFEGEVNICEIYQK